jgi:uncharacterized protein YkwD
LTVHIAPKSHAPHRRGRFRVLALATALIAAGFFAGPVPAQAAEPVVGGYTLSQARKIILDDTNAIRTDLGLKPVAESAALNTIAQNWSTKQANAGVMSHNPSFSTEYPVGWTTASENVAYGYSVTAIVAAWKGSPGHYRNMTHTSANTLGIGIAADSDGVLYYTQNFATYPTDSIPAPPVSTAPSIRTAGDVIAADESGQLWNYGKQGRIGVSARSLIGSGWTGVKELHINDWNADGTQDLVVQWAAGQMHVYPGRATGGFGSRFLIGSAGWGALEVDIAKWKTADRYPSIVMKDAAGKLWLYPNTRGATLSARTAIGTGWGSLSIKIADVDKDGKQDVLATTAQGKILLYRSNGVGRFVSETRKQVGSGWAGYISVVLTGFAGSGTSGFIARDSAGALYYYPILTGKFGPRQLIGTGGWLPMTLSND